LDATLAGYDIGEDEGLKDTACLAMTTESLSKEFQMHTPSLLNLIKTSENHTEELLGAKAGK
jgi:hypothetical protein